MRISIKRLSSPPPPPALMTHTNILWALHTMSPSKHLWKRKVTRKLSLGKQAIVLEISYQGKMTRQKKVALLSDKLNFTVRFDRN